MRRNLLLLVLLCAPLGACATGYATDWFQKSSAIMNPQLLRYGLTVEQSRCVGERLSARLSRSDLARLQQRAAALRPPAEAGGGGPVLTLSQLRAAAHNIADREIPLELDSSLTACKVPFNQAPAALTQADRRLGSVAAAGASREAVAGAGMPGRGGIPAGTPVPTSLTELPPPSGGAIAAAAASPRATWLNLGAASSGQSIGIDATSIEQEGATRTAWFRMTDPESGQPSNSAYRLRIDCSAQTVQPLALRQSGEGGAQPSVRQLVGPDAAPGPPESGTVLEIAFLSLCT
jgi:hypothetical protein